MDKIRSLANKLHALAQQGTGGEKSNAKAMLEKLCAKHGISLDSLGETDVKRMVFRFQYAYKSLMLHCILKATQGGDVYSRKLHKTEWLADVTHAQYIEILGMYAFYKRELRKLLSKTQQAFIIKNRIYPDVWEKEERTKEPKPDFELAAIHEAISPVPFLKQLPTNGKNS